METTLETLEGLERRLTLTVPVAGIEAEVAKRLQRLSRSVKMDGFRPGKAPMKMIQSRYGAEVRGEVLGEALQRRFFESVQQQDLKVAGYPRFEPAEAAEGAAEIAFRATFEVFPEVRIGDVGQIKLSRPVVEVADADVDRTLDILRKQRLHYHSVDRAAREGDRVHIDYAGTVDGQPFQGGEAKDFPLILGEGRTLKDFEGPLSDMKAGETKTIEVNFPEDYFAKEMAGKKAVFEVTLKSVHEPHLPEVDEAFAQSMGIHEGGVAKLREEIAENLRREAKRRIQTRLKEQVMDGLIGVTPFEVPKGLVAIEAQALMERAMEDLKQRGMRAEDIRLGESVFEPQARRRVQLRLLLNELARTQQITAGDEQVRALVEEFAQSYENPAEVVAWYYGNPERLREAQTLVLEDNIVGWVLDKAQVTDEAISMETLMGKAQ